MKKTTRRRHMGVRSRLFAAVLGGAAAIGVGSGRHTFAAAAAVATATKADEPQQQQPGNEPDVQEVPEAVPVLVVDPAPPAPNGPAATPGTPGQSAPAPAAAPVPRVIMVDPTTGVPLEPLDEEEQPTTEPSAETGAPGAAGPTTNPSRQLPPGRTFGPGNNNGRNNGGGNRSDRGSSRDPNAGGGRGSSFSRGGGGGGASASAAGLPADFSILYSRSIFVKGGRLPPIDSGERIPRDPGPPTPPVTPLVFVGVLKDESTANQAYAIIEDTMNAKVLVFKVGDSVPGGGKITNITLDKLDLAGSDGKTLSIALGQNLQGGAGPGVASRSIPITTGPGAASGATSGPAISAPPGSPRQPGESIADYLRRKRMEGK
jgi:hypothetical protein